MDEMLESVDTSCDIKTLEKVGSAITKLPKDKSFIRKIKRLTGERHKMFFEAKTLDWAMGEMLAYGSLLVEGHDVRVSGQDVERGTFSHRHAVIKVEDSEEELILLNSIADDQGKFSIYNSLLSDFVALAFVFGVVLGRGGVGLLLASALAGAKAEVEHFENSIVFYGVICLCALCARMAQTKGREKQQKWSPTTQEKRHAAETPNSILKTPFWEPKWFPRLPPRPPRTTPSLDFLRF